MEDTPDLFHFANRDCIDAIRSNDIQGGRSSLNLPFSLLRCFTCTSNHYRQLSVSFTRSQACDAILSEQTVNAWNARSNCKANSPNNAGSEEIIDICQPYLVDQYVCMLEK